MRNLLFILLFSLCDVQAELDVSLLFSSLLQEGLEAVGPDKVLAISADPTIQRFINDATLSSLEGGLGRVLFQASGHPSPGDFEVVVDLQKGARAPPSKAGPECKASLRDRHDRGKLSTSRKPRDGLIPLGLAS